MKHEDIPGALEFAYNRITELANNILKREGHLSGTSKADLGLIKAYLKQIKRQNESLIAWRQLQNS